MKHILVPAAMLIAAVVADAAQNHAVGLGRCPSALTLIPRAFLGQWGPGPIVIAACTKQEKRSKNAYACHSAYFISKPGLKCDITEIKPLDVGLAPAPLCFTRIDIGLTERCTVFRNNPNGIIPPPTRNNPNGIIPPPTTNYELLEIVDQGGGLMAPSAHLFIGRSGPPNWPGGVPVGDYGRLTSPH
jgi:hypothetical protein